MKDYLGRLIAVGDVVITNNSGIGSRGRHYAGVELATVVSFTPKNMVVKVHGKDKTRLVGANEVVIFQQRSSMTMASDMSGGV